MSEHNEPIDIDTREQDRALRAQLIHEGIIVPGGPEALPRRALPALPYLPIDAAGHRAALVDDGTERHAFGDLPSVNDRRARRRLK